MFARLSRLPGVTLFVGSGKNRLEKGGKIQEFSPTRKLSVCSEGVSLATLLDRISRDTGAAFDVSGDLTANVKLTEKGTVEEVVRQITNQTHIAITLAM